MHLKLILASGLILLFSPITLACEPILPLIILTAPPHIMSMSFTSGLEIEGLAFIVLLVVVLFKCSLFAWFEHQTMGLGKAFGLMLLGNILTTFVGLLATGMTFSGPFEALLIGMGLAFALAIPPAKRLKQYLLDEKKINISPYLLAFMVPVMLIMSLILFGLAHSQLNDMQHYAWYSYWSLKLIYILVGLGISMFLTTLWEEYVIFRFYRGTARPHFVPSTVKANLYTFLLVGLMGAVMALPARFQSYNFLIGWLQQIGMILS